MTAVSLILNGSILALSMSNFLFLSFESSFKSIDSELFSSDEFVFN